MFFSFLLSFLPFFDVNKVINYLVNFFPGQAEKVVEEILKIYQHRTSSSIISLLIAYFFSVGFVKTLHQAFLYVLQEVKTEKEWAFWIKMPFFVIVFTILMSLTPFLGLVLKVFMGYYTSYVLNFLTIWLIAFLTYFLFLPKKYKTKNIILGSLFFTFGMLLLNKLFSLILIKFITLNPLYGFLGSLLLFFVWVNLSFTLLLSGARFIQLLKEEG